MDQDQIFLKNEWIYKIKTTINNKNSQAFTSTGLYLIDLDHNRLSLLLNYIIDSIQKEKSIALIKKLAKHIEYALTIHFLHEELVMNAINYPGTESHKQMHLQMVGEYKNFTSTINNDSCFKNLEERFLRILAWVEFHVIQEDMQFVPYIKENKIYPSSAKENLSSIAETTSQKFYLKMQDTTEMIRLRKLCTKISKIKV